MGRGHAPGPQHRQGRGQGPGRRRGDCPERPREHARLADAAAPLHDRRRQPRLQLERSQPPLHRLGPLPPLDPLRGHQHDRGHHRHLGLAPGPDPCRLLGRSSARSPPRSGRNESSCSRWTPPCGTRPSTRPTTSPRRLRSRAGAAPTSVRASSGSTSRGYSQACASTSPTWSAPATRRAEPSFDVIWVSYGPPSSESNPRAVGRTHRSSAPDEFDSRRGGESAAPDEDGPGAVL